MNVLVVGMPNVGKSTLLNALRSQGIEGRESPTLISSPSLMTADTFLTATAKALRTSALPGMTRTVSTRLKLSEDPLVYSYDSPGVMLPFLGRGDKGAERGVKLALIGEYPAASDPPSADTELTARRAFPQRVLKKACTTSSRWPPTSSTG